jgi:two-component system response regulator PhoP
LLASRGYRVDVETDATAGLLRAVQGEYALVVADCDLGRDDGADVVRRILRDRPDVPVLVVTARDRQSVLERLEGSGVAECLEKPVSPERLIAAVEERLSPGGPS